MKSIQEVFSLADPKNKNGKSKKKPKTPQIFAEFLKHPQFYNELKFN